MATASSTKLRPLGDRVVIKPTPREEMTKSGIVLPDTAKEKPQEGEVLSVGPGKILDDGKREAIDVAVGDKVLYAKYAGTEFKIDDEDLLIVSQKDILAVVERLARANGEDLALLGLLLRGVRQDDARLRHLLTGRGLDDDAVAQRAKLRRRGGGQGSIPPVAALAAAGGLVAGAGTAASWAGARPSVDPPG